MLLDRIRYGLFAGRKHVLWPLRRVLPNFINRIDDPRDGALLCRCCDRFISCKGYHSGFSDVVAMYCSGCEGVLVVALRDLENFLPPHKEVPAGDFGRWKIPYWSRIEERYSACSCGGHFGYLNPPRCSLCHGEISGNLFDSKPALKEREGYFLVFGKEFRGQDALKNVEPV
jgi:hypothetical protein